MIQQRYGFRSDVKRDEYWYWSLHDSVFLIGVMMVDSSTIFAPASGPAPGAVAVIRLSGSAVMEALSVLTGRENWPPRQAVLSDFYEPNIAMAQTGSHRLDRGLVLWFPPPRSYTGEAMAELHIHGGRAVVSALCNALGSVPGLRMAEPGEFTRRAFDNGKLDLTEVEAVADLVAAETESQRRQAERQLSGAFGRQCQAWRDCLMDRIAFCEAEIDFSDQDLPADLLDDQRTKISNLRAEILATLDDGGAGERLRTGYEVILTGTPNVGKSTLFNTLVGRELTIVTDRPGTTRDLVEATVNLSGLPLTLIDTAGLRSTDEDSPGQSHLSGARKGESSEHLPLRGDRFMQDSMETDPIEQEGAKRARSRLCTADLVLLLTAPDSPSLPPLDLCGIPTMIVVAKADCLDNPAHVDILAERIRDATGLATTVPVLAVSAHTGAGLDDLRTHLIDYFQEKSQAVLSGPPGLTRQRHRVELTKVSEALAQALSQDALELQAEELRMAAHRMGRITGRVNVDDILGTIFERFCIGK